MANPVLHLSTITPVGIDDLNADRTTPQFDPDGYAFAHDDMTGARLFVYCQNRQGSLLAQGNLVTRVGGTNGTTTVTASTGTTTSVTISGSVTADAHTGAMLYIEDDAGAAGAAPEGEISRIIKNTTNKITVDPDRAFTKAIAASDICVIIGTFNIENSADGDFAYAIKGVVAGKDGISDKKFGWVQTWGMYPEASYSSATTYIGVSLRASSIAVKLRAASAATTFDLLIGYAPVVVASDLASGKAPAFLQLDFGRTAMTTGAVA